MPIRTIRRVYSKLLYLSGIKQPILSDVAWNNIKRMFVEPPLLRVDEFGGEFYIDPRSDLFSRLVTYGHYEPELAVLIKRFALKDRDAIDIGANIGFFTKLLSHSFDTGRVLACEPTVNAGKLLQRNLEHNRVSNAIIFNGAVSNENGKMTLTYVEGREEYSSLGEIEHQNAKTWEKKKITVPTKTVDQLVLEYSLRPSLIKVDVEGAEHSVFLGAIETLKSHRPIVISELDNSLLQKKGSSHTVVCDLFASLNYDVVDPYLEKWAHGLIKHNEILAIPRELNLHPIQQSFS